MIFKIKLAIFIMTTLLIGLVGLQTLYNYNLYMTESQVFKRSIDESLKEAIQLSRKQKRDRTIAALKKRLENPSLFDLKTVWKENSNTLQFQLREVNSNNKNKQLSISFEDLNKRPVLKGQEKDMFIPRFLQNVEKDLQKEYMWYYTQDIGDFLIAQNKKDRISLDQLKTNFEKILKAKNRETNFVFNARKENSIVTQTYEIEPDYYAKKQVYAVFPNATAHLLKQQLWSILGSFFLVFTVLIASIYVTKLLLTQERLAKEKDALMSHISHELRTPIAAIQVTAEAMKTFDQTKEEQSQYLNIILRKTQELSTFTHDILNELNLSKSRFYKEEFPIKILFENLKKEIGTESIKLNIDAENILLIANKKHIENLLRNLIANSIKYNESDSIRIILRAYIANKSVYLEVQDNGIGIQDLHKKKIFDPFYRVTNPENKTYKVPGFGIGLSYVKRVVELHNAQIEILDVLPNGSIFKLKFPHEKN